MLYSRKNIFKQKRDQFLGVKTSAINNQNVQENYFVYNFQIKHETPEFQALWKYAKCIPQPQNNRFNCVSCIVTQFSYFYCNSNI